MYVSPSRFRATRGLRRPTAPGHVGRMYPGGARRGPKRAPTRVRDVAWTAIAIVVAVAVSIAVGAFYWFIA